MPAMTPEDMPTSSGAAGAWGVATAAVCAMYRDGRSAASLAYDVSQASYGQGVGTGGGSPTAVVDRVVVPPGYAAVVRALSSPDSGLGTLFLVTDEGKRYPVPDVEQLSWLGYGSVKPLDLPSLVVSRIPVGPSLDPADAQLPVSGS